MRARRFDYYGSPARQPYVLFNFFGPVVHEYCPSRADWDASRIRALRAATRPAKCAYDPLPADRVPTLERAQRETKGTDGWDRPVLMHGDLSDRNIIVDPDTPAITGLIDWEMANVMPAYYEYVAARLSGGHTPEWRRELLDVLRDVLRHECAQDLGKESGGGTGEGDGGYREMLAAWDAIVDAERFAHRIGDECYWTLIQVFRITRPYMT
ncbi:aminoglycoside phosphotransferase family protein [Phanerochaete sordida]|uniref:Aminoglycoside phosphotransferase family protein n=1 Tax=Phanerochaete sordida TaxID=48140 RepID=A0A9P3GBQ1_9APHY|nr:aminoglycoside phosphotransferase family protein [Phanerochaete sordida]